MERVVAEQHWWEQPLRIIQLNLVVPDAARDGAQMAARVHEYGANALLINAGGIYAFYPTDAPYHRRAPGLASDLLGDAIRASHERGMRVIVRYDLIGLHRDAYEAHPEWFYRATDGRPMIDKGLYMTCPNGGWWQEQFFVLWDELTSRYDVDGLFFNAWGHKESTREGQYLGPCHCANCVRLFQERYHRSLPRTRDKRDPAFWLNQAFRRKTLDALGRRIYAYAKARNPEVALFAGAGHRALATGQADCTEIELHCGTTTAASGARWRHAAGESCKLVAALGPGFASGINAVYCHVGPGRWRLTAAPAGWLGYTLAQTIANAGWPYCMMLGTLDTQPDRTGLPALRDVLTYARDHEAMYRGLTSAARIGLIWSQRSATETAEWSDPLRKAVLPFRGWYDLLTRRHRLFDVVSDIQLEGGGSPGQQSAEQLRARYALLILPNASQLSADACAILDRYVTLGGHLIATGAPPLAPDETDAEAIPDTSRQAEAAGLRTLGARRRLASIDGVSNSYFRIRAEDRGGAEGACLRGGALDALDLLPVEGTLWYVETRASSRAQLGLIPPEEYGAPEQTYFTIETAHPGIIWHRAGEGRTAYLPWEPDRAWLETSVPALGAFLDALVQTLAAPAVAELGEAPAHEAVELTAHRQTGTGRLLLHLVNGTGVAPPRWSDPVALRDVSLRFRWDGASGPPVVRAVRAGATLTAAPVPSSAETYAVTLPQLDLFELLTVEPSSQRG